MEYVALLWIIGSLVLGAAACVLSKYLGKGVLYAGFAGALVTANTVAAKVATVGTIELSATLGIYSITFLITDCMAEFHGKKETQKMVWAGLVALVIFVFVTQIVNYLEPAPFWQGQEAFATILGVTWRTALASMITYLIVQQHDIWAFHFWKKKTKGKHLWLRNNLSTIASQTLDTLLFYTIAFYGIFPVWPIILATVPVKIGIAALDTPFLYLTREWAKPAEEQV